MWRVWGGSRGAERTIDSNRSFAVTSNLRIFLAAWETLRHMLDFRSNVSCFGFGEQTCGWVIWITTFATNLESVLAYHWGVWLLVVNYMLSESLLFIFRTPIIGSNMWSITICTCGFSWLSARASFVWMILSADHTLLFWSTSFCWVARTLAVVALHDRNWGSKFFHLI